MVIIVWMYSLFLGANFFRYCCDINTLYLVIDEL